MRVIRTSRLTLAIVVTICFMACDKTTEDSTILPCGVEIHRYDVSDPLGFGSWARLMFKNLNEFCITVEAAEPWTFGLTQMWAVQLDSNECSQWMVLARPHTYLAIYEDSRLMYATTYHLGGY